MKYSWTESLRLIYQTHKRLIYLISIHTVEYGQSLPLHKMDMHGVAAWMRILMERDVLRIL